MRDSRNNHRIKSINNPECVLRDTPPVTHPEEAPTVRGTTTPSRKDFRRPLRRPGPILKVDPGPGVLSKSETVDKGNQISTMVPLLNHRTQPPRNQRSIKSSVELSGWDSSMLGSNDTCMSKFGGCGEGYSNGEDSREIISLRSLYLGSGS